MRKSRFLSLMAVMILGICLTACSKKSTDREAASEPAAPPAQIQTIEPTVPKTPTEMPAQEGSSSVQGSTHVDTSQPDTAPKNSEPISSTTSSEQSTAETVPIEQMIDIDLTGFNANMLYAEVYNMEMSPEDYKGKIIKLTGEFACFPKDADENGNPTSDEKIFVCMISDAMACCATGIEFIPERESSFWTNYPKDGDKITVTGLCDIFLDEGGWFTVIQLDNATVEQSD